jgi:hypothetical protein
MQSAPIPSPPAFSSDFVHLFEHLLPLRAAEEIFLAHGPRGGGLPRLSGWQWLMARVFHVMSPLGDFAGHVKQIAGTHISNSALSQRGTSIGWENQGELTLARQVCAQGASPPRTLLLGGRLYGVPSLIHESSPAWSATEARCFCGPRKTRPHGS